MTTEQKIEATWREIVEKDLSPSVTAFSKMAGVSTSSIYHNYPEWADKIKQRRDDAQGAKKKSPVTKKVSDSEHKMKEQIKLLQTELYAVKKQVVELAQIAEERDILASEVEILKQRNEFLVGGYQYLIEQLQLAGVKQEKIRNIHKAFEKNILITSN